MDENQVLAHLALWGRSFLLAIQLLEAMHIPWLVAPFAVCLLFPRHVPVATAWAGPPTCRTVD